MVTADLGFYPGEDVLPASCRDLTGLRRSTTTSVFVSFAPAHLPDDASGEEWASDFFSALALLLSLQSALLPLPPVVGPLASAVELLEVSRQFDLRVRSLLVRSPCDCDEALELEELGAEEVLSAGGAVLGV